MAEGGVTTLEALLAGAPEVRPRAVVGDLQVPIRAVGYDSRRVAPGTLFCCLPGSLVDGHDFAPAAVAAGAAALVVERPLGLAPDRVPAEIVVDDARRALGHLAAAHAGHPSRQLTVVGITGTNGKTTTAHLVAAVLERHGWPTAVLGTLSGVHTTPEAPELQARLAELVAGGTRAVAVEVSSHALALHRVAGTWFAAAVFTNLGRDHLDFHGTVERYFAAKARLFEPELAAQGIINVDDVHGRLLVDAATIPVTAFGAADVSDVVVGPTHHEYTWRGRRVRVPIGGRFNVWNSLAAATTAEALGLPLDDIVAGLAAAPPVPGRFESVVAGQPFTVLVDYAHTPEGLAEVLGAARDAAAGHRVLVVFGCGGDRDPEKRPQMGAVAAERADRVVLTSDNPRSEDPQAIIDGVLDGIEPERRDRVAAIEVDRRAAIEVALRDAEPGDVVVIAGKGHEATQTIGATVLPFDDRAVARELLAVLT